MTKRLLLVALMLGGGVLAAAQSIERANIPDTYKADLTPLYQTPEAWRAAKERFAQDLGAMAAFTGTLGQSAARLADALETMSRLDKEVSRLYVYASLLSDADTRVSANQATRQEMVQLATGFNAAIAFIEPEVLRIDAAQIGTFVATERRLGAYRLYLADITRRRAHTLSDREEKMLADAGTMASSPGDIYGIFANADFPYPTVTLADGKAVRVDQSGFTLYRTVPERAVREQVMSAFFGALGQFRGTFGSTMNAKVQKDVFYANARVYPSTLAASLDGPNIPTSVYTRLIDGVNRHLPTFHRYLKLRKRMMGLDALHYYDLYAPLVGSVDARYTVEQAQARVLHATEVLGPEYQRTLTRAFAERWIDYLPSPGKRSGAYSNGGAYDVHPYMLLNYNGRYEDVSRLAHELGHTLQSALSNTAQPYPLAQYPIFVAEVASTFNENLLIDDMLKTMTSDDERLSLLGSYLENIKGTVFRQTQFAEFELAAHEMAEKGRPVTGDALATLYFDITKKYYGHDQGVAIVDDYVRHEWSYIPHFYRDYYVFQYATSFTASTALSEKVLAGAPGARERYLAFLSAGGSKYPIELLKDAGVDMTTDEPLDLTMKKMNQVMDEMERILARRGRK